MLWIVLTSIGLSFVIHGVDAANPEGTVKILHLMLAHTVIISSGVSH